MLPVIFIAWLIVVCCFAFVAVEAYIMFDSLKLKSNVEAQREEISLVRLEQEQLTDWDRRFNEHIKVQSQGHKVYTYEEVEHYREHQRSG